MTFEDRALDLQTAQTPAWASDRAGSSGRGDEGRAAEEAEAEATPPGRSCGRPPEYDDPSRGVRRESGESSRKPRVAATHLLRLSQGISETVGRAIDPFLVPGLDRPGGSELVRHVCVFWGGSSLQKKVKRKKGRRRPKFFFS